MAEGGILNYPIRMNSTSKIKNVSFYELKFVTRKNVNIWQWIHYVF